MGKIFSIDDGGLLLIPPGEYKAELLMYEEKKGLAYGDAVKMYYQISDGEFKGTVLNHLVADKKSPQSNLAKEIRALKKATIKVGEDLDMDSLIGNPVIIAVATISGKGDFGEFSTIIKVKPITKGDIPF